MHILQTLVIFLRTLDKSLCADWNSADNLTLYISARANPSGGCVLSVMHGYVDDCHAFIFKLITNF